MSLRSILSSFAAFVGHNVLTKIFAVRDDLDAKIGDLSTLPTVAKDSASAAIVEVHSSVSAVNTRIDELLDDTQASSSTAYSSTKTDALIAASKTDLKAELIGSASTALDTLGEVEARFLAGDDTATALVGMVGNRIRFDEEQTLTDDQKTQAQENLGLGDLADLQSELEASFLSTFEPA